MPVIQKITIVLSLLIAILFSTASTSFAQNITGTIYNSEKEPIPYANIFVRQLGSGTSSDGEGKYYLNLLPGEYNMVVTSVGYESEEIIVTIEDGELVRDIILKSSSVELDEIVVRAAKRDPAYAIIQNAIDHKKEFLNQIESSRCKVYVKALEEIENNKPKSEKALKKEAERKEKQKEAEEKEREKQKEEGVDPMDPFAAEAEKAKAELASKINMIEMQVQLNFKAPNKYKEERTAYHVYGNKAGLFVPLFGEVDFNFYHNLVDLTGIMEVPVISPISRTAIIAYKFKLIESIPEKGVLVHKIKVTPRKSGNSTVKGYIYINDEIWNINRLDLDVDRGGLKFFDQFNLKQSYTQIDEKLWIPNRIEMTYETKQGRFKKFKGNTVLFFSDFENDFVFEDKFFGNELAVTTQEAYERDTLYWKKTRVEPLTLEQQQIVSYRDSLKAITESKAYKDSIQAKYNKVTFLEVFWEGIGFRDHEKKSQVNFTSLPQLLDFEIVGGFRAGPWASYFREFENKKRLWTYGGLNIGFKNADVLGNGYAYFLYNPLRRGSITLWGGRSFESINYYDAFLNQLRASNYILNDNFGVRHRIELVNGLFLSADFSYSDRFSIDNLNTESFLEELIPPEEIISFDNYQALITNLRLSYTPGQKYMTEPNQKIILGSKFPTFTVYHQRGWDKLFSSDVNFDYLGFRITQDITFGVFGNTKYNINVGKFVNTKNLRFIDLKRFRESDPYLFSNGLHSFQLLDTSLTTTKPFVELHHIHHFNGALVNNIPLIKKTKIRVVAGGGFLYVQEDNYRHEELFAGVERVFKLGARRRLRLGVYGVLANSNALEKPDSAIKFSIDVIDTWDRNWNF